MSENLARHATNGEKTRKLAVNKLNWKREQQKLKRYSRKALPIMPKCSHSGNIFCCKSIKGIDALAFSESFYYWKTKIAQDSFILMHTKINFPKRNRGTGGPPKAFSVQYFMRNKKSKLLRVCQNTFSSILGITKFRIKGIVKKHFVTKSLPVETRGGDRISHKFAEKRTAIINFVQKFKVIDVHYCRSRVSSRQYLSGELSINKIYTMFAKAFPELQVKRSYFRYNFNRNFNIGFKTPSSDVCSTCQSLKEQLKIEKDLQKRSLLMTTSRVHKMRAKAFYSLAKEENENIATFSFDCQKNMVLPKLADQAAYYSRQLYLYNLGIVQGSSKSKLEKGNVFLYLWTENFRPKGSNEIASAVYHRLQCTSFQNNVNKVPFICDGCGAQNKNSSMMAMCSYWLSMKAPNNIKKIEIIFPVPGHSYIPPDRVFAQLEKKVKRMEIIIKPQEYIDLYKDNGCIINLGRSECPVQDGKNAAAKTFKPPGQWHFKFNASKRFIITRLKNGSVGIRGETPYKSDIGVSKSVVKKGQTIQNFALEILENNVSVKSEKLKDVNSLLQKHFGTDWRLNEELLFYKNILDAAQNSVEPILADEICEPTEDDVDLKI